MKKMLPAVFAAFGLAGLAFAQSPQPSKIGTINVQQAVQNTQEAKAATAKLQREFVEPRTKALEAQQAELRELQEKLQRSGNTLSQTAKDDMQAEINKKTKLFNRGVEDYQADSEDKQRELLADFSTKMQAVMIAFGTDNGYAVIFDTSNRDQSGLMWAASSIDVTMAVVAAYDKAHPATVPTGATATPAPAPPPAPIKPATPPPAATKPPATQTPPPAATPAKP